MRVMRNVAYGVGIVAAGALIVGCGTVPVASPGLFVGFAIAIGLATDLKRPRRTGREWLNVLIVSCVGSAVLLSALYLINGLIAERFQVSVASWRVVRSMLPLPMMCLIIWSGFDATGGRVGEILVAMLLCPVVGVVSVLVGLVAAGFAVLARAVTASDAMAITLAIIGCAALLYWGFKVSKSRED